MSSHLISARHLSDAVVAVLGQDVVRRYKETHADFEAFPDKVAFQLNDTHPTIAVAELMRVLMDENKLGWTKSWDMTTKVPVARAGSARLAGDSVQSLLLGWTLLCNTSCRRSRPVEYFVWLCGPGISGM